VAKNAEQKPAPQAALQEDALSFEQILGKLESVVESLEQGDRPLEEALATFEQGVALARKGARRLDEAERRIELLLDEDNGLRTRPLDPIDPIDKELPTDE
jgi:exodeoxyribonuclease VII small subunit